MVQPPPSRIKTFTEPERQLLVELVAPSIMLLDSKKTDGTSSQRKKETWLRISREFNRSTLVQNKALPEQLKRLWFNMKARNKLAQRRQTQFSGGGPPTNTDDPESEQVMLIMPHLMQTVSVTHDSDTFASNETEEQDDKSWLRKLRRSKPQIDHSQQITQEQEDETINQNAYSPTADEMQYMSPAIDIGADNMHHNTPPQREQNSYMVQHTALGRKVQGQQQTLNELKRQLVNEDIEYRKRKADEELRHTAYVNKVKAQLLKEDLQATKEKNRLEILQVQGPQQSLHELKRQLASDDIEYRKRKADEEFRHITYVNKVKEQLIEEDLQATKEKNRLEILILKKQLEKFTSTCTNV